jgi:hypothetical protein
VSKLYLTFEEMLANSNTPEGGLYKWALVGDEFRFVRVICYENHRMLVEDGEEATDAGTISTANDRWKTYGLGSVTLKVGCGADAAERLAALLGNAGRKEPEIYW